MSENKEQSINLNIIFKIIYKNIFLIGLVTVLMAGLAGFYAFTSKSFKSEIILYGNDKVLNEIVENSQYSLNSFDFFRFIQKNSKTLTNIKLPEKKFLKEMSKKLTAQTETGDPTVKVKFSNSNKIEAESFSEEYADLAAKYLATREDDFLDKQIKLLEEQYNFMANNVDLRTTKDSLSDTLVSRLAYYKLLKSDTSPLVKLVNINVKPALNKKFVLAGGIFAGLFLGILIAFIKEFSKSLDWKDIKSK